MKKLTKEYQNKTAKELEKLSQTLYEEMAKMKLNEKANPSKDTNIVKKKKKQLAVLLTLLTQKKELEKIQTESHK